MERKRHKIFDHPILSYFILFLIAQIFTSLGGSIDNLLAGFIPGYAAEVTMMGKIQMSASGIGVAIGAMVAVGLFNLWFRKEFRGMLGLKGMGTAVLMLLPVLILHWIGSVASWVQFGTASVFIAFLRAFAPGFGEEIAFRGLGVANYMRTIKSEKQITVIFWLSSVFFGLVHITNAFVGADPIMAVIQALYAIGIGLLLGAVFLRTGLLWPIILGHMSLDFMEFIRADMGSSGGIMVNFGVGDWITIAAGVLGAVVGIYLMRKKNYPEIMELWRNKWNKNEAETPEVID